MLGAEESVLSRAVERAVNRECQGWGGMGEGWGSCLSLRLGEFWRRTCLQRP